MQRPSPKLLRLGLLAFLIAVAIGGLMVAYRSPAKPYLLLITLDTTRADRLGCYGYQPAATPQLDALARRGVLFERAYAPAPMTSPSHTSMMTGLWPPEHGVVTNGVTALEDDLSTVAELLQRRGYQTAAFPSASMLKAKFGLQQGFQDYFDDLSDTKAGADPLHRSRDGRHTVDAFLAWLKRKIQKKSKEPFFCWIHLYDPHEPYLSHTDEFGDQFADRPYDGELAYVDRQLGRIFDALQQQGLADKTVVVVAGDHGESFGEHGEHEHGYLLHEPTLRVPLLIADPRRPAPAVKIATPVSLVDLFPTLLELGGVQPPEFCRTRSLTPTLAGQTIPARFIYSQTEEPYLLAGWSPQQGLTTDRYRYVRSTKPELYDLSVDPQERDNLTDKSTDIVSELDGELAAIEARFQRRAGKAVGLSTQERRALESLGYTGGSSSDSNVPPRESLTDVKEMMEYLTSYQQAIHLLNEEKFEEAAAILEPVAKQAPQFLRVLLNLGQCRLRQNRYDEAVHWYQAALQIDPDSEEAIDKLGFTHIRQGDLAQAERLFRRLLELRPESQEAYLYLGEIAQRRENYPLAMRYYAEVLKINPQHRAAGEALAALRAALLSP